MDNYHRVSAANWAVKYAQCLLNRVHKGDSYVIRAYDRDAPWTEKELRDAADRLERYAAEVSTPFPEIYDNPDPRELRAAAYTVRCAAESAAS